LKKELRRATSISTSEPCQELLVVKAATGSENFTQLKGGVLWGEGGRVLLERLNGGLANDRNAEPGTKEGEKGLRCSYGGGQAN